MGLFDSYSTPVNEIPTGFGLAVSPVPYAVVLTDVKKHTKEKDGTVSTVLTFSVDPSVDQNGRKGKEDIWITHPVDGNKNADIHAKVAKQWVLNLGIPDHVYGVEGFEIVDVKDKIVGNVRGYLSIVAADNGNTNKRFVRHVDKGTTGPSEVKVPEPKQEEAVDFAKLLQEQDNSGGTW